MPPFQAKILLWKIIIDALEQIVHCFVSFFFNINIEQIIAQWISDNSLMKKYYKSNCHFHKIIKK